MFISHRKLEKHFSILEWKNNPGVWVYYVGALRYILRCDVALIGPMMGIWEAKEEPSELQMLGENHWRSQKKGS